MQKLFGLDTDLMAIYLLVLFCIFTFVILYKGLRNPILVKLAVRNIPKRMGQSSLIIFGLMLSTVIIEASLGIGDTVYNSIKRTALESVGYVDESISSPQRFSDARYFPENTIKNIDNILKDNSQIDGVISRISTNLPVLNIRTNRTEARMTIRGYKADRQSSFGEIIALDGTPSPLINLQSNEVLLNENAGEILEAKIGDNIEIYTGKNKTTFTVKNIVQHGGLASGGDTKLVLMSLNQIQNLINKPKLIDWIGISNTGGIIEGLDYSKEVSNLLRTNIVDREIANNISTILTESPIIIDDINNILIDNSFKRSNKLQTSVIDDLKIILKEIQQNKNSNSEKYFELIANQENVNGLIWILTYLEYNDQANSISLLSPQLNKLIVDETKSRSLKFAENIGSSVTTIFTIFGSFSIIVGLLLIFLVMVLLAAARSTEMGMARAIGLKRSHLVQMFIFEGSVYALLAAIIGTALGALVSLALVGLLKQAQGDIDDFPIYVTFTIKSLWIAFSSGFILTLITVGFSSYRISKLNIVVAIRGLSEELIKKQKPQFKTNLKLFGIALINPILTLWNYKNNLFEFNYRILINLIKLIIIFIISICIWPFNILKQIIKLLEPINRQGWPLILIGVYVHRLGINVDNGTLFTIGVSISILGLGLALRRILELIKIEKSLNHRISSTFEGLTFLLFYGLPFDTFESYTGELNTTPDIFVLGGVAMVGSSVWLIMNNSDLLLTASNKSFGRISGLQATVKTAVAYPLASPFRTGLTISMFGLVIFTLVIFAILNGLNNIAADQPDRVTGGYDISASVRKEFAIPIDEFKQIIDDSDALEIDQFEVIARSGSIPSIAREESGKEQQFKSLQIKYVDESYLNTNLLNFSYKNPKYAKTDKDIWEALLKDKNLAVVSSGAIPTDDPFDSNSNRFELSAFDVEGLNKDFWPESNVSVELLPVQGASSTTNIEIIGVLDPIADSLEWERSAYLITGKSIANQITNDLDEYNNYNIKLSKGTKAEDVIPFLETLFINRGLKANDNLKEIDKSLQTGNAFNKLFQGFMGLGLVVGVIAIGVLSIRAVVERRKLVGAMRAIGYRSNMVYLSFLLESLYITILGIILGISLGTWTAWNIFSSISKEVEGLNFDIPWTNLIIIILITLFFALLSSFWPARQASKIYPAEALRHE
ncbi:MAG: hypothetical protein CL758_09190 [Chloroflexi bacterium]|nr:hypothetical protein [Chloroflexota bacterium]|tara:strand:+ start:4773 stop:8294 length:3522 start_codon:yes stop_codon:yes gene_type:complete